MNNNREDFQTPREVCDYMVSLLQINFKKPVEVLEPTKGKGNLVNALEYKNHRVFAPDDFFKLKKIYENEIGDGGMWIRFQAVVMNPPFSSASCFNLPAGMEKGMKVGYRILEDAMCMSNVVIALMPWFVLLDSDVRMRRLKDFGLRSITALPRKTFQYSRIQTCVLHLDKNYDRETKFHTFNF